MPKPETPAKAPYPLGAAVLTACAATAILFLRRPIAFLHPQFYAEDGAIFFPGAEADPVGTILAPYAGYLLVGIRLVASIASLVDLRRIPDVYFAASLLAFVGLELALFSPRLNLPRPWILGLGVVLFPQSGEALGNLTNVQWITGLGLLLLVLARDPRGPADRALDLAYAALAGLTGVFSILFAPLFVARAAARRTGDAIVLAGVVLCAAAIQAYEVTRWTFPPSSGHPTADAVVAIFGARVWLSLVLTQGMADAVPTGLRDAAGVLGFLLLVSLAAGPRGHRRRNAVLSSALLFLFAAVIYKFRGELAQLRPVLAGDRYFFIPKVCVVWILVSYIGAASRWRWPARLLLATILVNGCIGFQFERWNDYDWPYWAKRIQTEDVVAVPTNPIGFTFTHHRLVGPGRVP